MIQYTYISFERRIIYAIIRIIFFNFYFVLFFDGFITIDS